MVFRELSHLKDFSNNIEILRFVFIEQYSILLASGTAQRVPDSMVVCEIMTLAAF